MNYKFILKLVQVLILSSILIYCNFIAINLEGRNTLDNIYYFSIIVFLATFLFGFEPTKLDKHSIGIIIAHILFWAFSFYALSIHGEYNYLQLFAFMLVPIPVMINKRVAQNIDLILISIAISVLPLIIVVQQSNSFGLIISLGIISFYCYCLIKGLYRIPLILTPIFTLLIYITESRTALVALFIFLLIYILLTVVLRRQTYLTMLFLISLVVGVVIVSTAIIRDLIDLIFNKRANTASNFLADRQVFWEGTFNYAMKPWGNGQDFFFRTFGIGDSHNLFVEILGIVGYIPLLLYIILIIGLLVSMFKVKELYLKIMMLAIVFYFSTGMAENLFILDNRLITYHFFFVALISLIIYKSNENGEQNEKYSYNRYSRFHRI